MSRLGGLLSRPQAGRISANLGWLFAEKLVRVFSSVAVGVWVARHLGSAPFGTLSYCLAILALLGCAGALGTDVILKRELIRRPNDAGKLIGNVFVLRMVAALVAILASSTWAWTFLEPEKRGVLLLASGILLLPLLSTPDLYLQANLKGRTSFYAGAIATVISAAGRVTCILVDAPLEVFGAMVSVETLVIGSLLWSSLRRAGIRIRLESFDAVVAGQLLRDSIPLLVGGIAVTIYTRIDQVMLGSMRNAAEVGAYSAAVRISEMGYFIPMVLAVGLFPSLVSARLDSKQEFERRAGLYFDLNAVVAYFLILPLAIFPRTIVGILFGSAYVEAGPVLAIHSWSLMFVFLGVARTQVLSADGVIIFQTVATVAGAVSNVALNFLLIPSHGAVGAAWATLISYAIAGWLSGGFCGRTQGVFLLQARALMVPILGWRHLISR